MLGQRRWRELVRDSQRGADPPAVVGHDLPGPPGRHRVHRNLLQPPEAPQLPGLPHTPRVRTADPTTPPPGGGIINLSVKPGQPHIARRYANDASECVPI